MVSAVYVSFKISNISQIGKKNGLKNFNQYYSYQIEVIYTFNQCCLWLIDHLI